MHNFIPKIRRKISPIRIIFNRLPLSQKIKTARLDFNLILSIVPLSFFFSIRTRNNKFVSSYISHVRHFSPRLEQECKKIHPWGSVGRGADRLAGGLKRVSWWWGGSFEERRGSAYARVNHVRGKERRGRERERAREGGRERRSERESSRYYRPIVGRPAYISVPPIGHPLTCQPPPAIL